ncbi:MAG: hypothetical protein ACE5LA_00940 [Dehalococcoidales bacterium]
MKKLLLIGSIVLVLGFLVAGFTTPIFAHSPDDDEAIPTNEEAWEAMHEACWSGDWEAMAEAAEEVHGENFDNMPCHDYYSPENGDRVPSNGWGGMGGHMGSGMMSW